MAVDMAELNTSEIDIECEAVTFYTDSKIHNIKDAILLRALSAQLATGLWPAEPIQSGGAEELVSEPAEPIQEMVLWNWCQSPAEPIQEEVLRSRCQSPAE
ncbi:unnamed protein product [Merluccius merluccius]